MKKAISLLVVLLMFVSLIAGCGGGTGTTPAPSGPAPATSAPASSAPAAGGSAAPAAQSASSFKGEIKIGLLSTDLTSLGGQMMQNGVQMAIDECNEKGGISGYKVVKVVEDTQGKPDVALNAAQKIIGANEVVAIIGPHHSSNVFAIEGIIKDSDIPFVIGGTNPGIPALKNPNIFGCRTNDTICARAAAAFIADFPGVTKVAVLTLSDDFGEGGKKIATSYFDEIGMAYMAESHNIGDTDMSATILKVKNAGCNAVFIWTLGEFDILVKQLYELGFQVPTITNPSLVNTQTIQNLDAEWIAGRYCTADFVINSPEPVTKNFVDKFKKLYDVAVDNMGACYYSGAVVLLEAMSRCSDPTDRAEIKKELLKTKDIVTPVGVYNAKPEINQQLLWGINIVTLTDDLQIKFIKFVEQ